MEVTNEGTFEGTLDEMFEEKNGSTFEEIKERIFERKEDDTLDFIPKGNKEGSYYGIYDGLVEDGYDCIT